LGPLMSRATVVAALLLCALMLAASAGPAHAATLALPYQSSFPVGFGAKSIAVNHATGNVLVLDTDDGSITQYDATGTPTPFTDPALAGATALSSANVPSMRVNLTLFAGVDVDNSGTASQGTIYLVDGSSSSVLVFAPSGELIRTITVESDEVCGLNVAPDGKLWIGTRDLDPIDTFADQYTSAGVRTGLRVRKPPAMTQTAWVCDVQPGADGSLYARPYPLVAKYGPDGVFQNTIGTDAEAMVVEPVTGNLFLLGSYSTMRVRQTSPDGEILEEHGGDALGFAASALALGPGGRQMYVVKGGGEVVVFGPAVRRPEMAAPGGVGTSSASLEGTVWPGGASTMYRFEYGTKKALGSVAPAVPVDAGSGTAPVAASAALTGLAPNTDYYYRLVATVGGVDFAGPTRTLRTLGPVAAISGFSGVGPTSVTLTGSADPRDLANGTYRFRVAEVGGGFEAASAEVALPAGSGVRPVSATIAGLPAGKTFTARLVASAGGAAGFSEEIRFSTPQLPAPGVVPVPEFGASPYGCGAPSLDALKGVRRPGEVVTVTGRDLGAGGTLTLGGSRVPGTSWSSTGVRFTVPRGAAGTLAVSVDCGRRSNGVALTVAAASNVIKLGKATIKGSSATVSVKAPGAGRLMTAGKYVAGFTVKVKKAGTVKAKLRLTKAGQRVLKRSHRLALSVRVRFVPTGGDGRTETKAITFTRGGAR
jgi:hypothetical protein